MAKPSDWYGDPWAAGPTQPDDTWGAEYASQNPGAQDFPSVPEAGDDQYDFIPKDEPPLVKVDPRKIKVFLMVINKNFGQTIIDTLSAPGSCYLRLEMVYHDYQSHFRIHARFDRRPEDVDHICDEYHRSYVILPSQAFSNIWTKSQLNQVENLSELPKQAQDDPNVQKAHEKGLLCTMEFDLMFMFTVNLHNEFFTKTSEADAIFRNLRILDGKKAKITLILEGGMKTRGAIDEFKTHLFKELDPLHQYYHNTGNYAVEWGARKDQKDTLSHKVEAQITYMTKAQWYITNMYGVLRNEEDALNIDKYIEFRSRKVSFFEAPGRSLRNGMHRHYLVFLEIDEQECSSSALDIGQFLLVTWTPPQSSDDSDEKRIGWKGQILPSLAGIGVSGNLLLLITRPDEDKRVLEINEKITGNMKNDKAPIWLMLDQSSLSSKRLVNALNLVHSGETDQNKILQRVLLANDFSNIQFGTSLNKLQAYDDQKAEIELLYNQLSPSQRVAMSRVMDSNQFVEFITGPFGTGKTTFIARLTQCLVLLGKKVLLCCSSNAAVDILANKIEQANPELKAVRFHSLNTETKAISRLGMQNRQKFARENKAESSQGNANDISNELPLEGVQLNEPSLEDVQQNEPLPEGEIADVDPDLEVLRRTYARLIPLSKFLAKGAGGSRPNFSTMSLMARSLAQAGINGEQETPQHSNDEYNGFRELFLHGDESNEGFNKLFNAAITTLQADVLANAFVVLTTFSNSADKLLKDMFHPTWIIGDEVGATQDAELLIPITSFSDRIEHFLGVGDAQQFSPVIKTYNKKESDGSMVNEFADSLVQPLILRAQRAGLRIGLLMECFRCTAGLEQPSSRLFYNDKVTNGSGTALADRPKSQRTILFMKDNYQVETTISRMIIDVKNGVCLTGVSGSRFNLHHISMTLQLVEQLVSQNVFQPSEIAIQIPYREQNSRYRSAMAAAAIDAFWKDKNIWAMSLMTVDSFQGGERPCIILDMVTATNRKGGLGFLQQRRRLNVALTRAMDAIFVIADVQAILHQTKVSQAVVEGEQLDPESQGLDLTELQERQNYLKRVMKYFADQNSTYAIEKEGLSQKYVSFKESEDFLVDNAQVCFNCQQQGHLKSNCPNPAKSRPSKVSRCRICEMEDHKQADCPERVCHNCGETGHFKSECPKKKAITCYNCGEVGHGSKSCPRPRKSNKSKDCYTCGRSDHESGDCPNKPSR